MKINYPQSLDFFFFDFILQGRLKVPDATKTTIIILVRDYGYEVDVEELISMFIH
jgi:hypothetical protein